MKDSNELFELCKQVYEATGWDDTRDYYHEKDSFNFDTRSFERNGEWTVVERRRAPYDIPLYTSDYLLEKLPKEIESNTLGVVWNRMSNDFQGEYGDGVAVERPFKTNADTPLKALLKLTIKLHEEKIL